MSRRLWTRSLVLFTVALAACGGVPTVERDGFVLGAQSWNKDERAVRSQASFAMDCPAEQLELTVLSSSNGPSVPGDARGVAVIGCGKRTSWVRLADGTWAQNTESAGA